MSLEGRLRRGDARDHRVGVGVEQVLDHHHRVVALLERLRVEERRQPRKRLGVVVDGDGHVLLRGGELVGDLLGELVDERLCWHGRHSSGRRLTITSPYAACAAGRLWAMATCLVTGGAGFLGSHLCDELLSRGPPRHLRRQPRDRIAGEHRAHPRRASSSSATSTSSIRSSSRSRSTSSTTWLRPLRRSTICGCRCTR